MGTRQSLLSIALGLNDKAFTTGMQRSLRSLDQFSRQATRTGKSLSTTLTAPLVGIGALATKTFVDFERQMAKVGAISGATGSQFEALKQNALDLGSSTVFAASEVATLQEEFAKLGFNSSEIVAATGDTLALAQAFGIELNDAAAVVGTTLNQFNLEADESGRVADVMAAAFSNSALDVEKFRESMKTAGPVANSLGLSLEETTAALGVLANSGIDGSLAGNALKRAFTELQKEGPDVVKAFRGILTNQLSFADATELLGDRAAVLGTILGGQAGEVDKLTEALNNSQGTAKGFAADIDNTLGGSLASLRSAIEGAAIEIGEALAPAIRSVADFVRGLAKRFTELSPETQGLIIKIAGLAAAIGPAVFIGGKLAGTIASVTRAVKFLSGAVAANPLGAILLAATALVPIIANLSNQLNGFNAEAEVASRIAEKTSDALIDERVKVEQLTGVLGDNTASIAERKKALGELQSISPQYFSNLDAEESGIKEVTAATQGYLAAFEAKIKLQAAEELYTEELKKQLRIEQERAKELENTGSQLSNAIQFANLFNQSLNNAITGDGFQTNLQVDQQQNNEVLESLRSTIQTLKDEVSQNTIEIPISTTRTESFGGGQGTTPLTERAFVELEPLEPLKPKDILAPELQQPITLEVRTEGAIKAGEDLEALADKQRRVDDIAASVSSGVDSVFGSLAQNAEAAENSIGAIALKTIGAALSASLAQAVQLAFAPTPDNVATGGLAGAAKAAGLTALITGLFSQIPALASGGITTGPTLAMIGDNPSGKELVLPLEKAEKFFNNGGNVNVSGRLQGRTIYLAGERGNRQRGR